MNISLSQMALFSAAMVAMRILNRHRLIMETQNGDLPRQSSRRNSNLVPPVMKQVCNWLCRSAGLIHDCRIC